MDYLFGTTPKKPASSTSVSTSTTSTTSTTPTVTTTSTSYIDSWFSKKVVVPTDAPTSTSASSTPLSTSGILPCLFLRDYNFYHCIMSYCLEASNQDDSENASEELSDKKSESKEIEGKSRYTNSFSTTSTIGILFFIVNTYLISNTLGINAQTAFERRLIFIKPKRL